MKTDVWIASIGWDYRADDDVPTRPVGNDDTKLPIDNVWFRLGYGAGYLGDAETARLQKIYEDQGIGFYGVFVPTLGNWGTQIANTLNALRWTRGLQFDVEPYGAYLGSEAGLQSWLDNFLRPLVSHGIPPDKEISLCYDPRPQWLDGWDAALAVNLVDSLAPMVYTGMFSGQGVWGDPVRAIEEAAGQCPKGMPFRPILQAYQITPTDTLASFERAVRYGGKPQLFRRGVTPKQTWDAIAAMTDPTAPEPPAPEEEEEMSSREFQECMEEIKKVDATLNASIEKVFGQLKADIAEWREDVRRQIAALGSTPAPAPRPRSHTVKAGDTAGAIAGQYGISLQRLKDLNPGKPRSGNWNLIYPGEKFRVA